MNIQLIDTAEFATTRGPANCRYPTVNINPMSGHISLNTKATTTLGIVSGKEHLAIGQAEGEWYLKATDGEGLRLKIKNNGKTAILINKALAKHLLKEMALPGKELCTHKFRLATEAVGEGYHCIFHKSPLSVK